MDTQESLRVGIPGAGGNQLHGSAMALGAGISNQAGAALGAMAFPVLGPVGVVAVRQILTAVVLTALVRVRFSRLTAGQWRPVIGLAFSFCLMNICLYAAIERIGLGLAVTLEFLGPLAVALAGSRRAVDALFALIAGGGVLLLVRPGPSTDMPGILLALAAAVGWAGYILLNRSAGQRLPGLQGTAAASLCTTILWVPVAGVWFLHHPPTPGALALAAGCAVLASVVPYALDLLALRHLSAATFGVLTSINPIWAVLMGLLLLGQQLGWGELAGIGLIVLGASLHSLCSARAV
ncbi:EamA family transporter [Glutamicibacter sp. MNS18]|uniref:EamA family transporter n=1 Tax=Glutamicibacter sp. MNS18 TaxID=2989817 RepID=UPI00223610DE|nr:EamA family transporter [Glutamicibacter sp. MNS18]MCW4465554.1 EamA family transporter [Glutamicibacter sp. MNS18]